MFMELFLRIKYVKIVYSIHLQAVFDPVLPASTSKSMYLLSLTCVPQEMLITEGATLKWLSALAVLC